MYQLDIIAEIPEAKPDGAIYIRQGESALVEFDKNHNVSSIQISGRTAEQMEKTIPALVIAISDDPQEIFSGFQKPCDPKEKIPFLAISSDRNTLSKCSAEGKIYYHMTADCPDGYRDPWQYMKEIMRKTEYCFIFCSQTDTGFIHLAGELAQLGREQKTLMVLAIIGKQQPDSFENINEIIDKFHTSILPSDRSDSPVQAPIHRIRDLCEATMGDLVSQGGRPSFTNQDRTVVEGLLFNGGVCYLGRHIAGSPDNRELFKGFIQSIGGNCKTPIVGTYSILKVPPESTTDVAYDLGGYVSDYLSLNILSRYSPQVRLEVSYPEIETQYDMNIWIFTGNTNYLD
jgi:hypothetical protein